jgi:neutral amino acid transport system permease protein
MSAEQLVVNGVVLGCIIALSAIGLSMTYRILNFANLAHGDFVTLGAYAAFLFSALWGIGIFFAFFLAIVATSLFSMGLDVVVWKRMRSKGANRTALMILSIGLALCLRNLLVFGFGPDIQRYPMPLKEGMSIGSIVVTSYQLAVVAVAVLLMFAVHHLLTTTTIGKAMRALSDNMDLARISGIDVDRVIRYTWAIGMALAAAAGVLYGLITNVNPNMGWFMVIPIFSAAILGGIGNPYGAMLGGMVIGLSQELSTLILPSEYKIAVSFLIMIVVLLLRPEGIMGGR